jgi:hypothetical protein
LLKVLWAENVIARRYFYPGCHQMEPYRSRYPHAGLLLPTTESVAERVLLLPNGTALSEDQVREICSVLKLAVAHAAVLADRLSSPTLPEASMLNLDARLAAEAALAEGA